MTGKVVANISIDKNRVYRRLHIKDGTTAYDYTENVFETLCDIAKNTMEISNLYCIKDNNFSFGVEELDKCEKIVFCYSSAANSIIDAIESFMEKDEYLESYILNDLSNEIIFNGSREMNNEIYNLTKSMGYNLTGRYSPGENEMSLELQEKVLKIFKDEFDVNAHLTENYMLYPEKSMLYFFGMDKNIPDVSIEHDCTKCQNISCFYRTVD